MKSKSRTKFAWARATTLGCAAFGLVAMPAGPAQANSAAVDYFRNRADRSAVPSLLSQDEREYYRDLFTSIDRKEWTRVQDLLAKRRDGPLHQQALAEYYLAAGSPRVELDALNAWLATGSALPQAQQIGRLALRRGAPGLPASAGAQGFVSLPAMSRRLRPAPVADGTMPARIAEAILGRIKEDDPAGARQLLDGIDSLLSPSARAEWRQRVAWSFYIGNDDASAYQMAQLAADGEGPWVGEAWWAAGLAAWRLDDCQGAADSFARAASRAENPELRAASLYWQSRALVRCRQPELAAAPLRLAAARDETLYGMLAAEQLGLRLEARHAEADFTQADWQRLRGDSNVRTVVALAEIGQDAMADELLRHQARIGPPDEYPSLTRLARDLGLPATQLWMGYNTPRGGIAEPAARFPTPKWTPVGGWSVDPALLFAHALPESVFRATAVSPAGARGLMQIMPSAARDHAGSLGFSGIPADLDKPEVNLAFGQRHMQMLKDSPGTQGLLPKVMAAYNAGLAPVTRWNAEVRDGGDPLLWIESIPYWETRGYVSIVMRNYWMYERQAGGASESRMALAQGLWPTFPGLGASQGLRMNRNGTLLRGR